MKYLSEKEGAPIPLNGHNGENKLNVRNLYLISFKKMYTFIGIV